VAALQKIDRFLNLIQDGTWHNLKTLSKKFRIPKKKLENLSELLAVPSIVEYNPEKSQVKIRKRWRKLLENTDTEGRSKRAAVGTVVLPPESAVSIQGVQLTNLLEKEIEISVKLNTRVRAIAIGVVEKD
jgi:hypothetical protein